MSELGTVSELWRYPVSSLGGERLAAAALDPNGIAGDRLWGVADAENGAVARPLERRWRGAPELAARSGADGLEIRLPGEDWRPAPGPDAAAALTRHFGFPAEIRRHVPFGAEHGPDAVAPRYRRASLHLLTAASMRALRAHLPAGSVVDPRRFRPNVVVETEAGPEGPVEAGWVGREIAVGGAKARVTEPCSRCAFTTLAQGDLPFDKAILAAIARLGGGRFGVLCEIVEPRPVAVGDRVRLL